MSNSVRPGNRERGWNDPPEFLHTTESNLANIVPNKKTILNKRVSHTLDGLVSTNNVSATTVTASASGITTAATATTTVTSTTEETNQNSDSPRLLMPPVSLNQQTLNNSLNEHINETESSSVDTPDLQQQPTLLTIEEIENLLNLSVKHCKDNNLPNKTCEDILKRVKIFVTNWSKLNENVKIKMNSLVKALENSEYNVANDIHIRLMMDYPSEVSQWMVGIKKLIHELINIENVKIKQQQQSGLEPQQLEQQPIESTTNDAQVPDPNPIPDPKPIQTYII